MTFEKALEAMKQGKKAGRRAWADWDKSKMIFLKGDYFYWVGEEDIGVALTLDFLEADDWEIYEEPKKSEQIESYMSNAHAITVLEKLLETEDFLECARELNTSVTGVCNCIKFAIQTIKEQNQPEPEKKCECKCLDKLEEVYKFISYLYTECEFTPGLAEKVTDCYESLKDFLYHHRKL